MGTFLVIVFAILLVSFPFVYRATKNGQNPENATRIVQLANGMYQVQAWTHNSSDWEQACTLGWEEIYQYGFRMKGTVPTLEEAQRIRAEYERAVANNENSYKIIKVIKD